MSNNMKFETNLEFNGARAKADKMAKEFTKLTGIELKFNHFYIDSPYYGYIDKLEDYPKDDPDSLFVFLFDEADNNYETVDFVPSLDSARVWRSLSNDNPYDVDGEDYGCEGAVDPTTGIASWEDDIYDGLYKLSEWKKYRRPKV